MDTSLLFSYFPDLSDKQKEQFAMLKDLYADWNSKINVISRKDMDEFYLHHVLHSLAIGKLVPFKAMTEIMDAGTGGGFPGVPLAILFPDVRFLLVDSIGKKIKVVNEVVKSLGLKNVEAVQTRVEQVDRTFDFIISRAVTDLEVFTRWTFYKVHRQSFNRLPNGILYLKGMGIDDEIDRVKKLKMTKVSMYPISRYFAGEYFQSKQIVHVYK
jgi:16S rRNA (guanine527-N7)-methyltransferase